MQLLSDIAKDESRAVLAVTHDPRTQPYADRIIRIEDGKIIDDERPVTSGENVTRYDLKRKRKLHA